MDREDTRLLTAGDWVVVDTTMYDDYSFGTGRVLDTDPAEGQPELLVLYKDSRDGWVARWFYWYELHGHEPTDEEVSAWTIAYLETT